MPKLWHDTIQQHRRAVHEAALDNAAALVAEHGLTAVTMSQIAEATGIGRATLYKYFPDVEAILVSWHERHVRRHLEHLVAVRERFKEPDKRLEAVLEAYALISHERSRGHRAGHDDARGHGAVGGHARARGGTAKHARAEHGREIDALVHRNEHVAAVERRLVEFVRELVAKAAAAGRVRRDVPAEELARYALGALAVAGSLPSRSAVRRLLAVVLAGLRPPR